MFKPNVRNLSRRGLDLIYRTLPRFKDVMATSDDPDVQVAAFVVPEVGPIVSGSNRLPVGITHELLEETGARMGSVIVHAEAKALDAYGGFKLDNPPIDMVLSWFPCGSCARLLAAHGVRTLVCQEPDLNHPKWGASFRDAADVLQRNRVIVEYYEVLS